MLALFSFILVTQNDDDKKHSLFLKVPFFPLCQLKSYLLWNFSLEDAESENLKTGMTLQV